MFRSLYSISLSVIIVIVMALTVESCVDHNLDAPVVVNCDGVETVSFSNDIRPIITSNCAIQGDGFCHNGNNGADIDWRVLSNFQNHASEVKRRVVLPATDPDHMPRIGKLELSQIQLLVCWVEQGAQNN